VNPRRHGERIVSGTLLVAAAVAIAGWYADARIQRYFIGAALAACVVWSVAYARLWRDYLAADQRAQRLADGMQHWLVYRQRLAVGRKIPLMNVTLARLAGCGPRRILDVTAADGKSYELVLLPPATTNPLMEEVPL